MKILIDTNVLTRLVNKAAHEERALAFRSLIKLREGGHVPCAVPQVLCEFWAVATQPAAEGGLDFTADQTRREIEELLTLVRFLQDEEAVHTIWLSLVTSYQLVGKATYDARLVASMIRHGISHIMTFTMEDFKAFTEVTAIHPAAIAAGGLRLA